MIDFLVKGGIFMWPILLCSVISVAIFLERIVALRRQRILPSDFLIQIEDLIRREKVADALLLCKRDQSSIANILMAGIVNFGKRREVIKERIEEVGRREAARLERFLDAMATIASVATLLGLLGTIQGMIIIFSVISEKTVVNPTDLARGISIALYTTAFGLSVAIPTIVGQRYLVGRVDTHILAMEEASVQMVELLKAKEEADVDVAGSRGRDI